MTVIDGLIADADKWAQEARSVADTIRDIEEVPGETWVVANAIADDLEEFAWDLRTGALNGIT